MKALVLERKMELSLRDFDIAEELGPRDVRVQIDVVGICGSDIHYYTHGKIGPFVVRKPMILGHEASGVVLQIGNEVTHLKVGQRVCMEPGIPDSTSRPSRLGKYNLDPAVQFWATPPIHGCLRPEVIHPADFTFAIPANVTQAEAAMVEPLAVGLHAATKAQIKPGDVALVTGAGPIGVLTALAALSAGCSRVTITDVIPEKLELARTLGPITALHATESDVTGEILAATDGWGADVVFEASGNAKAASGVFKPLCPGGTVVYVGIPLEPIAYDVAEAQVKEARIEHVFRYAHVFPRALALIAGGGIDVKPLITDRFSFDESVKAFEFAASMPPSTVKAQIELN
jgi:D-xylulose reductase